MIRGGGTAYPSAASGLTPIFDEGSCCSIFIFLFSVMSICVSLCAIFHFSWSLYCLSFELGLLIIALVLGSVS